MARSRQLCAPQVPGGAPLRRWIGGLALAVAAAACGAANDPAESGEDGEGGPPGATAGSCPAGATDESAAAAMARACGRRVEIESARTEYAMMYVEPSGRRTLEVAVVPQRARRDDGSWGPLDTAPSPADATAPPTGESQWAYATSDNRNAPTTDAKIASGDPSPAAAELSVGVNPPSGARIRSFLRFDISALAGKQILSASLSGRVDHTWKCGAGRPTFFYRSDAIAAVPRQAWPGPALQVLLGNNNVHANEDSCNEANVHFEVGTAVLINDLQAFVNASAPSYFVAMSAGENAGGTNESQTERWMRYFLADFVLNITFNSAPSQPDTLTVDGKPCGTGDSRAFVTTTTPTLRARVGDPDGDSLNVAFTWATWSGSAFVDTGSATQGLVPSGSTALVTATGNVDGGVYAFRVQSDDSPGHAPFLVSGVAGTCEWQVDVTPPGVPAVTADIYLEGQTSGSVGQTGRFTLSSSVDTAAFLWGWSDPPTTPVTPASLGGSAAIDWTPASSGAHTLFVRALDRAGNATDRAYQFIVAPESTAVARWPLNDLPGTAQLVDDTGHGNALTVVGAVLGAPGRLVPGADGVSRSAIAFDGTGGGAASSGPVVADTRKSFSVAAWVKLGDASVSRRAVEQVGVATGRSAFALEYAQPRNAWKFAAPSADSSGQPGAVSKVTPRLNTWTHLIGIYDSAAGQLQLYVDGALQGTATGISTWGADGPLQIGASWVGAISDVQIWNRVLSPQEIFDLTDPIQVGRVGDWHMDEIGLGPAFDASPMAHDLTFFNGASIPASGAGQTGTGLRLDGIDDHAAPDGQVLHTDQSFAVSAWVRPTTIAVAQAFVSQLGDGPNAGFALSFGPENGGVWKFEMPASATDTANTTSAAAPAAAVTDRFHHLVGVFDAQHRRLQLYVDGTLAAGSRMTAAWQPWDATGPLQIGRDSQATGDFTNGDVDEVRVYQGVFDTVTRIP